MKLAFIPARGGSKRLPGKNLMTLAGKPLIQWTIEAAFDSACFDAVCVSTDCEDIAMVAKKSGADVPFMRPADLASDHAGTAEVLAHFVPAYEARENRPVTSVCLLQPTSPLRQKEDIHHAMNLLQEQSLDAVVSVCKLEHPIQLCNRLGPDNSLEGFIDQKNIRRTQDYDDYYRLNGAIYAFQRQLAEDITRLYDRGVRSRACIMSAENSIDIDTALDFDLASLVLDRRLRQQREM